MFNSTIQILAIFYYMKVYCEAYNYCHNSKEQELCFNSIASKHVTCHKNILEKQGDFVTFIPMSRKLRSIVLNKHNECRDELAGGNFTDEAGIFFPKAARLREFIWDQELAFLARSHARYCTSKHDTCRNTEKFRNSGQNLGWFGDSEPLSVTSTLIQILQYMCDERQLIANANEFPSSIPKDISRKANFILIANDRVSRVGCGFAYCKNCNRAHCYYLTCNYDADIPTENKVYEIDLQQSASQCSDWSTIKSQKYTNLCANNPHVFIYD